nr:MAG TPA: hypothetical protein [Caudoviricetes sp.]DAZ25446.1 MAG TPA: hypothetical protein [Caudoviricetes sp.]
MMYSAIKMPAHRTAAVESCHKDGLENTNAVRAMNTVSRNPVMV